MSDDSGEDDEEKEKEQDDEENGAVVEGQSGVGDAGAEVEGENGHHTSNQPKVEHKDGEASIGISEDTVNQGNDNEHKPKSDRPGRQGYGSVSPRPRSRSGKIKFWFKLKI
jgi:hypothetical protein